MIIALTEKGFKQKRTRARPFLFMEENFCVRQKFFTYFEKSCMKMRLLTNAVNNYVLLL